MATMALGGKPSHFAVLKIETSSDEDPSNAGDTQEMNSKSKNAKRKERKKKKAAKLAAADKELRGMAFKNPSKSTGSQNRPSKTPSTNSCLADSKRYDEMLEAKNLDDDMKEAIRLSMASCHNASKKENFHPDFKETDADSLSKNVTASAGQGVNSDSREQGKVHKTAPPPGIQEFDQQLDQESMKKLLKLKDKEIAMLKTSLATTKASLTEVKERNSQLCMMLAHGEMKSKEELLIRIQELTSKISLLKGEVNVNQL